MKSGAPDIAIAILDSLDTKNLADYHIKYRLSIYRNAYGLKISTLLLPRDRMNAIKKAREFQDTAYAMTEPGSRGHYILEAEKLLDAGLPEQALAKMEEANRIFDFSDNAALQYTMGEMYLAAGHKEKAIEALAHSAMQDIMGGVKEYRSLILLASILFENGETDRAFHYINCAFEDADFSRANMRHAEIMSSMPVIDRAYHSAEKIVSERTRKFLVLASCLVIMLIISLILMARAFTDKRKMIATIEKINDTLSQKNRELKEADSLKLKHINNLLLANAAYISRLKNFRKTILRLLVSSQFEKAMQIVSSDKTDLIDIEAFHEMFDESFLSLFPDFVNKLNVVFISPLNLRQPNRLTPELRVIALMKLGMSSTSEISEMLHYSPQTIYNLRSSIKNQLSITFDEFLIYLADI